MKDRRKTGDKLSLDFLFRATDVLLCGRGKSLDFHQINRAFLREAMREYSERYRKASKKQKISLLSFLLNETRAKHIRFLKGDIAGVWLAGIGRCQDEERQG
jgi:hypothetical protein